MIDRTFKPRRLLGDVTTGTVVGTFCHFALRYLEGWTGSVREMNLVLFLTVIFTIGFVALFERYFPAVEEVREDAYAESGNQ